MLAILPDLMMSLFIDGDRVFSGQEKYNMATFMVLFLLITIEVVVIKVVTSDLEREEENSSDEGVSNDLLG